MFRAAAEKIVFFMLRHKWLDNSKREIYEYAIEVLLLNGGLLLINSILSLIFGRFPFFLIFLLVFVPIRKHLGGFHLKSSELCMICSVTFYLLTMLTSDIIYKKYGIFEIIIAAIFSFICLMLKPLHGKTVERENHNKQIANKIIVVDLLIIFLCRRADFIWTSALVLLDISALACYLIEKIKIWITAEKQIEPIL